MTVADQLARLLKAGIADLTNQSCESRRIC